MADLLPCPFCGGSAEICFHQATGIAWVRCMDCDTSIGASTDLNKAIEFWNERHESKSLICYPIDEWHELHGTDCPAWKCSVCGDEFPAESNYCSNCGAWINKEKLTKAIDIQKGKEND